MKYVIDTDAKEMVLVQDGQEQKLPLYSRDAFEALSDLWVKVGWDQKFSYTFSWFGRPVIQLPEDMIRTQEVLWRVKPDVLVETGVAHGGSLIYYASLMKAMDKGRVLGIDIEIRPHNRQAIESHPMAERISLLEGSSTAPEVVQAAKDFIRPGETVLVMLDSNHTYDHVLAELEAYAPLVTVGSYIVATDGIMSELTDVPRGDADWDKDNPTRAAADFAARHPEFQLELPEPAWVFNESDLRRTPTHWPGAWLKRIA